MPKIGVKEEDKTRKKVSSADEKKEKAKKVVGTEKGKANQTKKVQDTKKSNGKTVAKKKTDTKKETIKKVSSKNGEKKTVSKKETPKKSSTKKVDTAQKTAIKKTTTKKSVSAKNVIKKGNKKSVLTNILKTKKKTKSEEKEEVKTYLPEYYDLPYRYNDTIVKILYQTPKRIFVYWDISDNDRQRYINAFGENFFERTYPVLLVHNEELNYTFEVPINDFANSWYIDINDPKSKYVVQFGRKFKEIQKEQINYEAVQEEKINLQHDFIYIADSNKLETPNDHILFEKVPEKIVYRNVKTGVKTEKSVKQILRKISKTYDNPLAEESYKDLYKELYGDEILIEEYDISNPSSGGSSSFFK